MITILCNQNRSSKYNIKITFRRSDLLSMAIIDDKDYGFMIKGSNSWMYIDEDSYEELIGVMKNGK